jgi:DNA-directed RNA polymerase specialized sigma24 family protein
VTQPPYDDELSKRARQGDTAAFDLLLSRYDTRMRGFLRFQAERDSDVDELMQRTRLAVWRRMPGYDPSRRTPFMAFAYPSAARHSIGHGWSANIRCRSLRQARIIENGLDVPLHLPPDLRDRDLGTQQRQEAVKVQRGRAWVPEAVAQVVHE